MQSGVAYFPVSAPSEWVRLYSQHIKPGGLVLDLASGAGRNAVWLAKQGFNVVAIDRDESALMELKSKAPAVETHVVDLEQGYWPYVTTQFDAIVVCRYLHRPLLPLLASALAEGGILIYETFMHGHENYGHPKNQDYLLINNELLDTFKPLLDIVSYEEGLLQLPPNPAILQRIAAIKITA